MPRNWDAFDTRDARILVAGLPWEVRRWGETEAVCYCQQFTEAQRIAEALNRLDVRDRLRLLGRAP